MAETTSTLATGMLEVVRVGSARQSFALWQVLFSCSFSLGWINRSVGCSRSRDTDSGCSIFTVGIIILSRRYSTTASLGKFGSEMTTEARLGQFADTGHFRTTRSPVRVQPAVDWPRSCLLHQVENRGAHLGEAVRAPNCTKPDED